MTLAEENPLSSATIASFICDMLVMSVTLGKDALDACARMEAGVQNATVRGKNVTGWRNAPLRFQCVGGLGDTYIAMLDVLLLLCLLM